MRCLSKDQKFKNLTVGKDYPDANVVGEFIELTNDAGVLSRYNKKYFEERTRQRPSPPPPPPVTTMTVRQFVATLVLEQYEGEDLIYTHNRITAELHIHDSNISCGVYTISGMNDIRTFAHHLIQHILNSRDTLRISNLTDNSEAEIFCELMRRALSLVNITFILLSTNDAANPVFSVFDAAPGVIKSNVIENSNSGRPIAVWIVQRNLFILE
jgi:hypothetical protein